MTQMGLIANANSNQLFEVLKILADISKALPQNTAVNYTELLKEDYVPRMRTITEAYNEIRTADPKTALKLCMLRRMVNEGIIPSIKVERKIFLNYDILMDYLSMTIKTEESAECGKIGKAS